MEARMTSLLNPLEFHVSSGDLVAELKARAPEIGANASDYPGLLIYRYDQPAAPDWDEVSSLHLCIIAQGRKRIVMEDTDYFYDPFTYLAIPGGVPFETTIIEASPEKPFLSFGLQIDPAIVREVSSDIVAEREVVAFGETVTPCQDAFRSALDREMMDAVLRFLKSLNSPTDRRVVTPTYLREIVYRALQAEQYTRLVERAVNDTNPVSTAIAYVRGHLSEQLSVKDLAEQAYMSPSAFSHAFRDMAGRSPYQFIKDMRLNRGRELLMEDRLTVTEVSREVGYGSTSHFINEFRDRYGASPRAFGEAAKTALHDGVAVRTQGA
jgi:AraC-like DNA-binding protein